jgi:hypothetical protein
MKRNDFGMKTSVALLAAVLALAAGLRLWQLDRAALWEDDYLNLDRALLPLGLMWDLQKWQGPADTPYDFQPPLSFALEHLALDVSRASAAARMVSVAAGVLAVWGTFALGRGLFGAGPGLLAALLVCLSLFHIEYSRAIKAYGLFYCFSVWSCAFVRAAAAGGRLRHWAGWAVTATGMLYSAYIGFPAFAGQALWAAAMAGEGVLRRRPGAGRQALLAMASTAAVLAATAPWLPAVLFLQRMFFDASVDPLARLSLNYFKGVLAGFQAPAFAAPEWVVPASLALAAAGVVSALAGGRWRELTLMLLWVGTPTASVLLSKSVMTELATSRHVFNLLGALTLLPAAGAWAVARLVSGGAGPRLAAAATLCLALCWPQMAHLPDLYKRSISFDRDYFYWLWTKARPGDALGVEGWKRKSKAFGARWYLPGLFASPGDFSGPGPRGLMVVENQAGPEPMLGIPESVEVDDLRFGLFHTGARRLRVLSRSPLTVVPDAAGTYVYEDDFSTPRMLSDASSAVNAAPDLTLGHLAPVRATLPARAVYRFAVPDGVDIERAHLELGAVLYKKHPRHPSDAAIDVLAGPDAGSLALVRTIAWQDFLGTDGGLPLGPCKGYEEQPMYQTCAHASVEADLAGRYGRELWIEFRFRPGVSEGFVELDRMRLMARAGLTGAGTPDAARLELDALVSGNAVHPWSPGAVSLDGLFAFAAEGAGLTPRGPVNPASDLARFQAEHPGLAPAHVLRDGAGVPAVYFYDPPLKLSTRSPELAALLAKGFTARGMVLSGRLNAPTLRAGDSAASVLVAAPAGTTLMLNPGGRGKLIWSPDFSRDVFAAMDASPQDTLRPTPDADNDGGLTCREERSCVFTARFVSALPVSRVRLEWYPRVVADLSGKNAVRLSYSTDEGRTFVPVESFSGDGSGKWTGMFEKHAREIAFPAPVKHFTLKAELTGEDAQLWSHRRVVDRMWLEADLDARSVRPLALPGGTFPLSLDGPPGNDFDLALSPEPLPLYDSIKDWR